MTQGFAPTMRQPPAAPTDDVVIAAPPDLSNLPGRRLIVRLLPVGMSVVALAVVAVSVVSGSTAARTPAFLVFPLMMLVSMVLTAISQPGHRQRGRLDGQRHEYLEYLSELRARVTDTAAAQRESLRRDHPDPARLWTLIGGPRMWERHAGDPDFAVVRVGVGHCPLSTRLIGPEIQPGQRADPVTVAAARRFVDSYATVEQAPITIDLTANEYLTIVGDPAQARGLLRAMLCQLAVLHRPDQLWIVGVVEPGRRQYWDWLKWLPHNAHPVARDAVGALRMVYPNATEAHRELADVAPPARTVMIHDAEDSVDHGAAEALSNTTILRLRPGRDRSPVTIEPPGLPATVPDAMEPLDTLVCARRLAACGVDAGALRAGRAGWLELTGIDDIARFDPHSRWDRHDRCGALRAPLGYTVDGAPLDLDIKEAAENGMGPHGLCVGATGSGKSELLRTVALGMMARNSPSVLNLLLVDFKGGATFLDLAAAPHVAAVITNLSEDAPLVARMRDALAGEINRRQQLLRTAGCASKAAYDLTRRTHPARPPLPALFIVVDEFSELLSQHPDFADTFVAIGRLGRSLGMHLLLASQRLDEGRLRGLEAHLSYRVCLKTLSAGESRIVLGTTDAYQLPNTPGVGLLRVGSGELIGFHTAFVSGPAQPDPPAPVASSGDAPASVRLFTTEALGPVTRAGEEDAPGPSVLRGVLDRLAGHGPRAHQVWLPPLGSAPPLQPLLGDAGALRVPIGIIDRPFDQSRAPLTVDLSGAGGNAAVVGAPRSGKSTAVRTLITALAATHEPDQVQFYCLDFGGGMLTALRGLPHVGAVAGRAEPQLAVRMIAELASLVRGREASHLASGAGGRTRAGHVFLVIDGWAGLRHEFPDLEEPITALAGQGLSFGVHVVLSALRWAEIRPSLKDRLGTRIELRLGDPADSEIDRRRAHEVPRDRPGRGLSRDGLHMVVCPPIEVSAFAPRADGLAAPPIPLLPTHLEHDAVIRRADAATRPPDKAHILLGVEERRLRPIAIDFERNSHLVILGQNECGKTATLRTVCREIVRTTTPQQARLCIVDYRRSLLGVVESQHLDGYAMSPAALRALLPGLLDTLQRRMPPEEVSPAQLRARSWWSGPDVYLVVDDYDLVAAATGNPLLPLLEYLPHARDLGLHVIVARRSEGAARGLFEPLLAGLLEFGCVGLMMSAGPDDGTLLGSRRPVRLPAGRAVLVGRGGDQQALQVGWTPAP
ncbi:type VII secretion protein EccC [Mycobacterium sherrisii]|uniref:Type VII secretion protein EccC n=2 Tax=Mycobacterium sherrisii TaxID=243061 RepID=A0A1E3T4M6_9MYCO|nr:type VII secretion protein EccC [Mycobacterium sherrisii]